MDLLVYPGANDWRARLPDGTERPCVIGRGGAVPPSEKREGDGATPLGAWPVRRVLYRPDRVLAPRSELPVMPLARDLGWCDDPGHTAYNQAITLPFEAHHEVMWRADHLYDLVAILGYNDDPPVAGMGSAIFLHAAPANGSRTSGCVALDSAELQTALAQLGPGSHLRVQDSPPGF